MTALCHNGIYVPERGSLYNGPKVTLPGFAPAAAPAMPGQKRAEGWDLQHNSLLGQLLAPNCVPREILGRNSGKVIGTVGPKVSKETSLRTLGRVATNPEKWDASIV